MNNSITTVVFDIGNVLIEWNPEHLYKKLIPDTRDRKHFLETVCTAEWNLQQDLGRTWEDAVRSLSAEYPEQHDLIAAYSSRWHEMVPGEVPGVKNLLFDLKTQGTPLYAITNFSSEKFLEAQARFPFLKSSFLDIVVSAEERLLKPDPQIYHVLFERNGLAPETCFFIDDSAANVDAARGVGMTAHHFQSADALEKDFRRLGLLSDGKTG